VRGLAAVAVGARTMTTAATSGGLLSSSRWFITLSMFANVAW
jgi:hypothetical protein